MKFHKELSSGKQSPGSLHPTGSAARQLCSHHPNVNYKTAWGCPDCVMELRIALRESVKLQAHYASLLNVWDGGQRMIFENSEAWIARLRETKTLPPNTKLTP